MSGYTVALFFHLVGVITLFAGMAIQQLVGTRLRRADTVQEVRQWMGVLRPTAPILPAAVVILLASGLTMTAQSWTLRTPWIATALVALLAMAGAGATVLRRRFTALGRLSAQLPDGPVPPGLARLRSATALWATLTAMPGAALGIVWIMTNKPAGPVAPAVVLAAAAAGALTGAAASRPGTPARAAWAPRQEPGREVTR